jgi:hypothetical protein
LIRRVPPVATEVKVTGVPTGWGDAGFAVRLVITSPLVTLNGMLPFDDGLA